MIWKHRTCFCLICAGFLILLIAVLRPVDASSSDALDQMRADRFWAMKVRNAGNYDVVILGDSRSYRGVSPAEMSKTLKDLKIYNFAFSAGGLNPEIYAAADGMLNPDGKERIVLLGVTPGSLMESTESNRKYREEHSRPSSAYLERVYVNNHLERFTPFDWKAVLCTVIGEHYAPPKYVNRYMDDGWVGSDKFPEDQAEELEAYREVMAHYQIKPALVKALCEQTRTWTAKGIRVFGFRPPTSRAMFDLENKMSGFNEQSFIEDFVAAGGKWIPVDLSQYHSYDGSHLCEASAIRLSADIAARMVQDRVETRPGRVFGSLK